MDKAHETSAPQKRFLFRQQYTSVVQDTDTQEGKVYYRRQGNETQMALEFTKPASKICAVQRRQTAIIRAGLNRVTVYDAQKNQSRGGELSGIGFWWRRARSGEILRLEISGHGKSGRRGRRQTRSDSKNPKVLNMFPHIILWIDPARGVSVQQQFFQQGGDYRLSKYSDIQLNHKIPDAALSS